MRKLSTDTRSWLWTGAFFAVLSVFTWIYGPDLWGDFKLKNTKLVNANHLRVIEKNCYRKTGCTITVNNHSGEKVHKFHYFTFGIGIPQSIVIYTDQEMKMVTTSYGLSLFWLRLAAFFVVASFLVFLTSFGIYLSV